MHELYLPTWFWICIESLRDVITLITLNLFIEKNKKQRKKLFSTKEIETNTWRPMSLNFSPSSITPKNVKIQKDKTKS